MSKLQDARGKLKRANQHIRELEVEKSAFLQSNPYAVTPEYYPDSDTTVFFVDTFESVPQTIQLIVGDVLHNLRSALDLATWAAYRTGNSDSGKHIYFPISESAETHVSEAARKMKGVPQAFRDLVDRVKPYRGGNDILYALHKLDIIDKHQLLVLPVVCVGQVGLRITAEYVEREFRGLIRFKDRSAVTEQTVWSAMPPNSKIPSALKQGDPILSVAGNRETYNDVDLTFDIGVHEPDFIRNHALLPVLQDMFNAVSSVIDQYEPLFA